MFILFASFYFFYKMNDLFNITTEEEFQAACLETFQYQYKNVEVYQKFIDFLGKNPSEVKKIEDIPFLPIEMFKNHQVLDKVFVSAQTDKSTSYFQSSGTTQMLNRSKHYIADFNLYEESIYKSFEKFIGKPEDYIFLGLLPNYSENPYSSLIYMVDFLMKKSGKPENGYFLYNHQELFELLQKLGKEDKKVILFGVSFALLDFLDSITSDFGLRTSDFIVIETGGMKGRKAEITKDELLEILQKSFGTDKIYSEYSMTELLSQAYSLGNNEYECPNWMRVLIRNAEDPFSYLEDGKTGAINIIDLANRYSCSFIATQDLGRIEKREFENEKFQVLGRIDHSDIRGCSLLVS